MLLSLTGRKWRVSNKEKILFFHFGNKPDGRRDIGILAVTYGIKITSFGLYQWVLLVFFFSLVFVFKQDR